MAYVNCERNGRFPGWYVPVATIYTISPLFAVAAAWALSEALGCDVSGGRPPPCIVAGADIGWLLQTLGYMIMGLLVTVPTGLLALAAWVLVRAVSWWKCGR